MSCPRLSTHSAKDSYNIAEHVSIIDRQWKAMGIKLHNFIVWQKLISSLVTDVHKTDALNNMLFMLVAQAHMKILVPDYLFQFAKATHKWFAKETELYLWLVQIIPICHNWGRWVAGSGVGGWVRTFHNLSKRILTFLIWYSKYIVSNWFIIFECYLLSHFHFVCIIYSLVW